MHRRARSRFVAKKRPTGYIFRAPSGLTDLLKYAILTYFNLAKRTAKRLTARKIATCVAILSPHSCNVADY